MSSIYTLANDNLSQIVKHLDIWTIATLLCCGDRFLAQKVMAPNVTRLLEYSNRSIGRFSRLPTFCRELKGAMSIRLKLNSDTSFVHSDLYASLPPLDSISSLSLRYSEAASHWIDLVEAGSRFKNLSALSLVQGNIESLVWTSQRVKCLPPTLHRLRLTLSQESDVELGFYDLPLNLEHVAFWWEPNMNGDNKYVYIDWVERLVHLKTLQLRLVEGLTRNRDFLFPSSLERLEIPNFGSLSLKGLDDGLDHQEDPKTLLLIAPPTLTWLVSSDQLPMGPYAPCWHSLHHWELVIYSGLFMDDTKLEIPPNCTSLITPCIFDFQNLPSSLKSLVCGIEGSFGYEPSEMPHTWIGTISHIPSTVTFLSLPVCNHLVPILEVGLPSSLTALKAGAVWEVNATGEYFLPRLSTHSHLFPPSLRFIETEYDFFTRLSQEEVLQLGVDTTKTPERWISIDIAAALDNVPLLEYLLYQVGHRIIKSQVDAGYALKSACRHGSMRILEWIERKCLLGRYQQFDLSNCTFTLRSAPSCLTEALKNPNYAQIGEWLLKRGFQFCTFDSLVYDQLDDIDKLQWLSDHGYNLHDRYDNFSSPLITAVTQKKKSAHFLFNHFFKTINYPLPEPPSLQSASSRKNPATIQAIQQWTQTHDISTAIRAAITSDASIIDFMHEIDPSHLFMDPATEYARMKQMEHFKSFSQESHTAVLQRLSALYDFDM